MKKKISLLLMAAVVMSASMFAHDRKALRINEVMVENTENIIDEFGERSAWIELFNANFSPLQISAVYLTTDSTNKTMYPVPLGDVRTKMPKRSQILFYADSVPDRGTFHANFRLEPGKDNWIGIYDADGLTLIDEVLVPASLKANQSWARSDDGNGEWELRDNTEGKAITPAGNNIIKGTNPKIENFRTRDANGFAMTIMAMCIVFSALLVLCLAFYAIGAVNKRLSRVKKARSQGVAVTEVPRTDHDSGEEIAAVAMALYEHLNAHDSENTILTIKKMKRAYSPWSSKIYSIRELPRR